jgi:hypothetical protein
MTANTVQEECERLDAVALPGKAAALKNELLRSTWRLQRVEPKAASSIPPDRPRRRWR